MIQWECPVYAAKGISLRMIRTTVEMVRNVSYDRLEALIYFSDITENYFSEQIPHMLYRKNFDRIEIIDGQRDCVRLDHPVSVPWRWFWQKRSVIPVMLLKL